MRRFWPVLADCLLIVVAAGATFYALDCFFEWLSR